MVHWSRLPLAHTHGFNGRSCVIMIMGVLSCVIMIMGVLSCVIMIMGGIVMCDTDNGCYCHV